MDLRQIVHLVGGGEHMLRRDQSSSTYIHIGRSQQRRLPGVGTEAGLAGTG